MYIYTVYYVYLFIYIYMYIIFICIYVLSTDMSVYEHIWTTFPAAVYVC